MSRMAILAAALAAKQGRDAPGITTPACRDRATQRKDTTRVRIVPRGVEEMFRQRFRLCYRVEGDARFLSHHDLMRLWHRALRRSGLPLRMSEGFHVRPRVSFAMARGVGIASESEWLEFELSDWVNPDTVHREVAPQLPAGIAIRELHVVAPSDRAVVRRIVYRVRPERLPDDVDRRIAEFLDRPAAVVERGGQARRRRIDIRPLVASLERRGDELWIVALCRSDGSLRPEEVLAQLGFESEAVARSLVTRVESRIGPEQP